MILVLKLFDTYLYPASLALVPFDTNNLLSTILLANSSAAFAELLFDSLFVMRGRRRCWLSPIFSYADHDMETMSKHVRARFSN